MVMQGNRSSSSCKTKVRLQPSRRLSSSAGGIQKQQSFPNLPCISLPSQTIPFHSQASDHPSTKIHHSSPQGPPQPSFTHLVPNTKLLLQHPPSPPPLPIRASAVMSPGTEVHNPSSAALLCPSLQKQLHSSPLRATMTQGMVQLSLAPPPHN